VPATRRASTDRRSVRTHRALRRASVTATETSATSSEWLRGFEPFAPGRGPARRVRRVRKSGVNGWVRKDGYDLAVKAVIVSGPRRGSGSTGRAASRASAPRRQGARALIVWPLRSRTLASSRAWATAPRDDDWAVARPRRRFLRGAHGGLGRHDPAPSGVGERPRQSFAPRGRRAAKYAADAETRVGRALLDLIERPCAIARSTCARTSARSRSATSSCVRIRMRRLARLRKWMQDPTRTCGGTSRWRCPRERGAPGQKAPDILEFLRSDDRPFVARRRARRGASHSNAGRLDGNAHRGPAARALGGTGLARPDAGVEAVRAHRIFLSSASSPRRGRGIRAAPQLVTPPALVPGDRLVLRSARCHLTWPERVLCRTGWPSVIDEARSSFLGRVDRTEAMASPLGGPPSEGQPECPVTPGISTDKVGYVASCEQTGGQRFTFDARGHPSEGALRGLDRYLVS